MKFNLNQTDLKKIESQIVHFEEATGAELLVAVTKSSCDYQGPKLRFTIMAAILSSFVVSIFFHFEHNYMWPVVFAVFTTLYSVIAHLPFLTRWITGHEEMEEETYKKAMLTFFTKGTSKVNHKVTALIFISLLEHKIQVLVDEKLKEKISETDLKELIELMKKEFKKNQFADGISASVKRFEERVLKEFGAKVSEASPNELSNVVHFIPA